MRNCGVERKLFPAEKFLLVTGHAFLGDRSSRCYPTCANNRRCSLYGGNFKREATKRLKKETVKAIRRETRASLFVESTTREEIVQRPFDYVCVTHAAGSLLRSLEK